MALKKLKPGSLTDPDNYFDVRERALDKVQPAWAKAALALRTDMRFGHSAGSLRGMSLLKVNALLEVHRTRYEKGDTLQLLIAVKACAQENVPMPTWLANAYSKTLDSFLNIGGTPTLDSVFFSSTLPTATPKKAAAARQNWQLGAELMSALWSYALAEKDVDSLDAAFSHVLEKGRFGVKKTTARRLFLMVETSQIEFLRATGSNLQPLSEFLEKRRKFALM